MLPYRALWSNYDFAIYVLGKQIKPGDKVISMLPMAHMYGMAFEFIFEFLYGCHVFYLNRVPSPAIIAQALQEVKPVIVIAVPLIIEKIIRKKVFPKIQNNRIRLLLQMPVISKKVREMICQEVLKAFGGEMYEVIIGGAALNQEVEQFLKRIDFPYTVGYGATECAPIICYADWHTFAPGSCGRAALHQEVKIVSPDPEHIPGEILTKGLNVMLGYYKNPEATAETIDRDGWYHTGDLGTMDKFGNVFINGRSKNMLLGPNGQNIYPEEIEDKLNSMTMVMESIVVQRDNKLVALVHPDMDEAKNLGFSESDLKNIMDQNLNGLNEMIPAYEKITEIEIHEEEFEKTPKKSIKRYLYKYPQKEKLSFTVRAFSFSIHIYNNTNKYLNNDPVASPYVRSFPDTSFPYLPYSDSLLLQQEHDKSILDWNADGYTRSVPHGNASANVHPPHNTYLFL